jgi:AcrR family transcriptional regulator
MMTNWSVNKREKIIKVSLNLFMNKGFNETTIDEITKLANISKGSFYTYFKSKEDLLEKIIENLIENIEKRFYDITKNKTSDPTKILSDFFNLNISLADEFASSILMILRDVSFAPKKIREKFRESMLERINEKLQKFLIFLKKNYDENDILILWGILISLWGNIIFNGKEIDILSLSKKVWNGIGGEK